MKAADAKAPKFDSAWWKKNKSPLADITGKFADALTAYEAAKKKATPLTAASALPLAKALDTIVKLAKTNKTDPKLTAAQKETKEAFATYERLASAALGPLAAMAKDADFAACTSADPIKGLQDMVTRQSKVLHQFLVKDHSEEGLEFLVQVSRKVRNKQVYDMYVSPNGKKQVNFKGATQKGFDDVAAKGAAADWNLAPWKVAYDEILDGMARDNFVRFKNAYVKQLAGAVTLP